MLNEMWVWDAGGRVSRCGVRFGVNAAMCMYVGWNLEWYCNGQAVMQINSKTYVAYVSCKQDLLFTYFRSALITQDLLFIFKNLLYKL